MIDFEAVWTSDKLGACEESVRMEYVWLYGLADAHGSFEMNLRAIAGKVSPIRPELTVERLTFIFEEFQKNGLLFIWQNCGKKYAHFTGSQKRGRLPSKSHRARFMACTPKVPQNELIEYTSGFTSGFTSGRTSNTGLGLNLRTPPGPPGGGVSTSDDFSFHTPEGIVLVSVPKGRRMWTGPEREAMRGAHGDTLVSFFIRKGFVARIRKESENGEREGGE